MNNELIRFSGRSFTYYKKDKKNSLQIWDRVENDGFVLLSTLAKAAQTLPTSSATIEQSFSLMKLAKTDKRSRLSEENLQALMLTSQYYRERFEIREISDISIKIIEDQVLYHFQKMRDELNKSKNKNKGRNDDMFKEKIETKEENYEEKRRRRNSLV